MLGSLVHSYAHFYPIHPNLEESLSVSLNFPFLHFLHIVLGTFPSPPCWIYSYWIYEFHMKPLRNKLQLQ